MRPRFVVLLLPLGLGLCSFHCGVTQPVRLLDEGATELTCSLGGPFVTVGRTTFPVPYATVGIMHGASENVTVMGNAHLTALLFRNAAFDAGAAACLQKQDDLIPEVTVSGRLIFFGMFRHGAESRLYPEVSLTLSDRIGEQSLVYAGADNVFQSESPRYLFSPYLGLQFPLSRTCTAQVETKWMAANVRTSSGVFEGHGNLSNHGNTSLFFGLLFSL